MVGAKFGNIVMEMNNAGRPSADRRKQAIGGNSEDTATTEWHAGKDRELDIKIVPKFIYILVDVLAQYFNSFAFFIMRILIVCLGNICRSPMAEGVLKYKVKQNGLDWIVESAGTESYHVGEHPHKLAQKVCLKNGIDISEKRARKFIPNDFVLYDKIYVMAEDVYENVERIGGRNADMKKVDYFLNELHPGDDETVPDPYYGNEFGFVVVYDMINKVCDAIIEKYK
jgi:protein-tyrosine phosphatase